MRTLIVTLVVVIVGATALTHRVGTAANAGAPMVFFDIAGPDAARLKDFSGGTIETPKLPTPTGERFVLFTDPAGNRMGLAGMKQ
jgi:predicted enzyme related to lactoylglutathione lyase